MTRQPTVSIITTTYNMGDYIEECIESVLKQDYPYVEHIIQDAGSTDSTLKILRKYSRKKYRQRVKWISEIDNGQCDGLDRALKRSMGDIILVLNADDALMPYACSWAVENLKINPKVGAIYGDTYLIDEQSNIVGIYSAREYDFKKILTLDLVPPAQASFIRRSSLKKVGLYVDKTLDTCPDFEMWVRLGSEFPVKHVFGVVTKYRVFKKPQLDSGKDRTAQRCVISKKIVLDRLLKAKSTPETIKALRFKAYAGLYNWGAVTASSFGQIKDSVRFRWISLYYKPTPRKILDILQSYKILSTLLIVEFVIEHSFLKPVVEKVASIWKRLKEMLIKNLRVNFEDIDISRVESYWDDHPCNAGHSSSQRYTKKYFNEIERKKYFVEPHILKFAEFNNWKGKHVLEIGCGIGTDTINFARNGAQVTAVDISAESLKIAKKRAIIFGLEKKIKFYQADAENLSGTIKVEPYDLIYSFGVIHHTPHPHKVIQEIRQYCDENTILKIMVYHRLSWKVLWIITKYGRGAFWNFNPLVAANSEAMKDSPVTYSYTRKSITRLLRGFRTTNIRIEHIFPYEISTYKLHKYKKVWYFRWIPNPLFRLLEKKFGWHLLVEAKLQTNF